MKGSSIVKHIGVIGLGNMGMAMANNIIGSGFILTGYDLEDSRLQALKDLGGKIAQSPQEVGQQADAVFVMVLNGEQVYQVVAGDDGLLKSMKAGSIIYDLAVSQGGNSAFSEPDKVNVINGIKIMGAKNILNNLALTASNLYAKNLFNFVNHLYDKEKKDIYINKEDEIIGATLVNKD